MSKKSSNNLEYVKHVPDFIAKMGLSKQELQQHTEKNREYTIEDKQKTATTAPSKEEEKGEYDFENA